MLSFAPFYLVLRMVSGMYISYTATIPMSSLEQCNLEGKKETDGSWSSPAKWGYYECIPTGYKEIKTETNDSTTSKESK